MKPFHAVFVIVFGLLLACSQSTEGSGGSGGSAGSGAAGNGGTGGQGGTGGSGGEGGTGGTQAVCGDGHVDGSEDCDDGNRDNDDDCTNDCKVARCGDGIVATYTTLAYSSTILTTPKVTNPFGQGPAYVASTGKGDPSNWSMAPEHGICQALGYGLAFAVDWTSNVGSGNLTQLHAGNWKCDSIRSCGAGTAGTNEVCFPGNGCMLKTIDCRGEQCDDGADNSDTRPSACRTNCRKHYCGDYVVDSDEVCDDGGITCLADCSGLR